MTLTVLLYLDLNQDNLGNTQIRLLNVFQKTRVFQPWLCCCVTVVRSPHMFGLHCQAGVTALSPETLPNACQKKPRWKNRTHSATAGLEALRAGAPEEALAGGQFPVPTSPTSTLGPAAKILISLMPSCFAVLRPGRKSFLRAAFCRDWAGSFRVVVLGAGAGRQVPILQSQNR